jgi:ribonuclease HII
MPWVIGIDEAGYGPNLGPLVQAAAMAKLPAYDLAGWESLKDRIRRTHEDEDERLLIDDSKKVMVSEGLSGFYRTLAGWCQGALGNIVSSCSVSTTFEDVQSEYCSNLQFVEVHPCPGPSPIAACGLRPLLINVVVPARMNSSIETTGSKAPVLLRGYVNLVQSTFRFYFDSSHIDWLGDEEAVIIADKLGGRHYYAALVQETFPDGWVVTECETPQESRYRVECLPFKITAIFRPKADSGSVSVALASMMAKYVREMCMRDFNKFWTKHVPDLKPTAGYPGDARRFYREIEPAMKKLGIPKDVVWRKK